MQLSITKKPLGFIILSILASTILYYQLVHAGASIKEPFSNSINLVDIDLNILSKELSAKEDSVEKDGSIAFYFETSNENSFEVLPVRFEPKDSLLAHSYRCGLIFRSSKTIHQSLITVGINATETLSCDGISSIGLIKDNNKAQHIGIIYNYRSPNAEFRGSIIVSKDSKTGKWFVNEKLLHKNPNYQEANSILKLKNILLNKK